MKHNHLYRKTNIGKKTYDKATRAWTKNNYIVYRCMKPGCNHFIIPSLIIGKVAECWRCSLDFIINRKSLKNIRDLHCDDCTVKRSKPIEDTTLDFIKGLEREEIPLEINDD